MQRRINKVCIELNCAPNGIKSIIKNILNYRTNSDLYTIFCAFRHITISCFFLYEIIRKNINVFFTTQYEYYN